MSVSQQVQQKLIDLSGHINQQAVDKEGNIKMTPTQVTQCLDQVWNEMIPTLQNAVVEPQHAFKEQPPADQVVVSGKATPAPLVADMLGDVPKGAKNWPLFHAVCAIKLQPNVTNQTRNTLEYLKGTLADFHTVRCPECGGFGHTKTTCKTSWKLKNFFKG